MRKSGVVVARVSVRGAVGRRSRGNQACTAGPCRSPAGGCSRWRNRRAPATASVSRGDRTCATHAAVPSIESAVGARVALVLGSPRAPRAAAEPTAEPTAEPAADLLRPGCGGGLPLCDRPPRPRPLCASGRPRRLTNLAAFGSAGVTSSASLAGDGGGLSSRLRGDSACCTAVMVAAARLCPLLELPPADPSPFLLRHHGADGPTLKIEISSRDLCPRAAGSAAVWRESEEL